MPPEVNSYTVLCPERVIFCEFGGTQEKCKNWLKENHNDFYERIYGTCKLLDIGLFFLVSVTDELEKTSLDDKDDRTDRNKGAASGGTAEGKRAVVKDKSAALEAKLEKELKKKMVRIRCRMALTVDEGHGTCERNPLFTMEKCKHDVKLILFVTLQASKIIIKRVERTKRKCVTTVYGLEVFDVDLKKAAKMFATKFACGSSVAKNNQGQDEIVVQGDFSDEIMDLITENWPIIPEDNIDLVEDKKSKK
ncbi:translation initiation factor SUI1 [Jimgerdemannia flammicorona]|uniref:Translation machinery-associated protein 22 n=1 Tax=Jimgerdemannia flammicorona TaxID=994334 RepID=A0A433QJE1_9FUNG|nr:translation initiation factor SUI1 [Jimgerdemannia flammicorona]